MSNEDRQVLHGGGANRKVPSIIAQIDLVISMQLDQAGAFGSCSLGKTGLESISSLGFFLSDGTFFFRPFTQDRAFPTRPPLAAGPAVQHCTYVDHPDSAVLPVFLPGNFDPILLDRLSPEFQIR